MPLLLQTKCLHTKDTKKMRNRQVILCKSIKNAMKIIKNSTAMVKMLVVNKEAVPYCRRASLFYKAKTVYCL